jgi:plastocyanin
MNARKTTTILSLSVAAIIIASMTIMIALQTSLQTNNQNTVQANIQHYNPETREFWLFNSFIPGFNETLMGMPHDVYSMPTMTVFKGDTIIIHFFNTEGAGGDHHTFTIKDESYNINVELSPGQNKTITFDANTTGIFSYYCTFHQPTMRGQLIVKPPPY